MPGWIPNRADYFRMADGLVCPSCHEPLGNVILEACHYGVPVVTTRSFGAEELVTDGHSGLMVPVAVGGRSRPTGDNHLRSELADDANKITHELRLSPLLKRFLRSLRKPKLVVGRKELLGAIELARRKKLLRSDHTQGFEKLGAQQILAAFPAGRREIPRPRPLPT